LSSSANDNDYHLRGQPANVVLQIEINNSRRMVRLALAHALQYPALKGEFVALWHALAVPDSRPSPQLEK
jgi:hypothetical protein